jgi:hypothetical protein
MDQWRSHLPYTNIIGGGVNEATSLALSGIHFGHWKIFCLSSKLIQLICTQLNLVTRCGAPPSRWKNGLQVLLEKVPSIALVDKLRAILLMEGDFNFYNKWIFGHVALNKLYEIGYVPEDQYYWNPPRRVRTYEPFTSSSHQTECPNKWEALTSLLKNPSTDSCVT